MKKCLICKKEFRSRAQVFCCSNKCQADGRYRKYIEKWRAGEIENSTAPTINISRHIRRYFIEKHGEKCSLCGWNKKHPKTGRVPIEIDHIDGNAENNSEKNLQLLCPNCHSLTPYYKNFNIEIRVESGEKRYIQK